MIHADQNHQLNIGVDITCLEVRWFGDCGAGVWKAAKTLFFTPDTKLMQIKETHCAYDTLQYSLMFCCGEDGCSINILQLNPNYKALLRKLFLFHIFYSYQIMEIEWCRTAAPYSIGVCLINISLTYTPRKK